MTPGALHSRIRTAVPEDSGIVLSILRDGRLPADGVEDRFPVGYIVAEAGGSVIAVGGLEMYGSFGLLRSVAVAPEWQGQGIGKALTERLLELARYMGLKAIYLLTTTAQAFFEGKGFQRIDRKDVPAEVRASIEFAKSCPTSAICMFRKLA